MIEFVNRENSNCYKWCSEEAVGTLPLWVADMDFKAAPAIIKALKQRVEHGVFGYNIVPNEYYDAVNHWFSRRHGWNSISKDNTIPTIGVVPAISAILRAQKDYWKEKGYECLKVVTLTPAYNCFFSSTRNLEAELLESKLVNINNHFEIDFADLEEQLKKAQVLLLCNPHNPTGRVWSKGELQTIAALCKQYDTFVISDEIHCELCFPHCHYTPYATIAEDDFYCVCTSASKAFNIAGLQCANIFVPEKDMYSRIDKAINIHEVCDLNPFGIVATIAAYNESESWLEEVNLHIYNQYTYLKQFIENNLPQLTLTTAEGTYLAWIKLPEGTNSEQFCNQLKETEKVLFNNSEMYGAVNYFRLNLATSTDILKEALKRLAHFINNH